MKVLKGIDVSKYQEKIDWDKVKAYRDDEGQAITFAILRCGWGNNIQVQDDPYFKRNVEELTRLGIPYGVYFYSYAQTDQMLESEIAHAKRLLKGTKPFCVYFDMEDISTIYVGESTLTEFGIKFCKAMEKQGFKAGIYANQNWFRNHLDVARFAREGLSIWCAKYSKAVPEIAAEYDIWQYTSQGRIDGIVGHVDLNFMYKDLITPAKPVAPEAKLSSEELADNIIKGLYGNGDARKKKLASLGYTPKEIQSAQIIVNARLQNPGQSTKLSAEALATNMIKGMYGNGTARRQKLRSLGYTDTEIGAAQAIVNKRLG